LPAFAVDVVLVRGFDVSCGPSARASIAWRRAIAVGSVAASISAAAFWLLASVLGRSGFVATSVAVASLSLYFAFVVRDDSGARGGGPMGVVMATMAAVATWIAWSVEAGFLFGLMSWWCW